MSKIKIKLNEDHIKLIKHFKIEKFNDSSVGIDTINPYGGCYIYEDLAMILGYWDKSVEGTENDYDGRKFGLENEKLMIEPHVYLMSNIDYVLSIIFTFFNEGVKVGTYTCTDTLMDWKYN